MGYIGNRYSVRASIALSEGKNTKSNFSKSDFIENYGNLDLSKITLAECKSNLLACTEWHHTGSFYNRTDFYDYKMDISQEDIDAIVNNRAPRVKKEKVVKIPILVQATYTEFEGSRRHPKAVEYTSIGVVVSGWFFPEGKKYDKKSVNGKYYRHEEISEYQFKKWYKEENGNSLKGYAALINELIK